MNKKEIPPKVLQGFRDGCVIPVLPIALTDDRALDEVHERAVIRYYTDAGVGGILVEAAETKRPESAVRGRLLALASETIDRWCERKGRQILKMCGISSSAAQALEEADSAYRLGYHACLVNLPSAEGGSESAPLAHCASVAEAMPIVARHGGRPLSRELWRRLCEIDNVVGIALAHPSRFQTLEAARAVCEAGKEKEIALYTSSADRVLVDLLASYKIPTSAGIKQARIVGGLLAHWGVWTSRAAELLKHVHSLIRDNRPLPIELLSAETEAIDACAAVTDAAHGFAGAAAGINEILRRQKLFAGSWCLDPKASLSEGQSAEIDRVYAAHPELSDDDFVAENINRWLAE